MKTYKLTDEEKEIEQEIEHFIPISCRKKEQVEKIIEQAKKNRSISLRISNYTLEKLKEKANDEGIPYQRLINSILHKYITNQLFDKKEILKSLQFIDRTSLRGLSQDF